jgi:hypothetical protein
MYIVFCYEGEVYFSAIFDGLYKIDEQVVAPKIIPVMLHKNTYSLGLLGLLCITQTMDLLISLIL